MRILEFFRHPTVVLHWKCTFFGNITTYPALLRPVSPHHMKTLSLLAIRARIAFLVPLLAFCPVANVTAASSTTLAISIRTLSSPYQVMYKVGAEAYAKQVGLPLDVLTTEANSQKGLTDIKAEVARTGANVAFFIDPNDAADA